MGRLRSCEDADFIASITSEVTELFGTDDASLYRYSAAAAENIARKDPIWDEPTTTPAYKKFDVPVMWFDWSSNDLASESGDDSEVDAVAYISKNHLIGAGVPLDHDQDYVNVGDILVLHNKCGQQPFYFDIVQTDRDGWINSSADFTQYKMDLRRRQKYEPERKLT